MFNNINSILSRVTKRSGIKAELKTGECIRIFSEEAGKCIGFDLVQKIKPLYIKDAIITVASLSEEAIKALQLQEETILLKINASMGENILKKIRYLS